MLFGPSALFRRVFSSRLRRKDLQTSGQKKHEVLTALSKERRAAAGTAALLLRGNASRKGQFLSWNIAGYSIRVGSATLLHCLLALDDLRS